MTKKLFSKIVSAILVMALMLTTVFGCLITVSAAGAAGTYTITSDDVPSGARIATTYVTLTSDTGFSSGTFDLMFDSTLLDADENGILYADYENGVTVLPEDKNNDGMISATDTDDDGVADVKENETNNGVKLPNAYEEYYVDTDNDGINDKVASKLYDTKIEIYSATATDGTALDISTVFTAPTDDTTDFATDADGRSYKYALLDEYKNYEASETTLHKYSRSYSRVDVATANLSYDISTVSEDSTGLVGRYTQYAQGFKNVSFDAGNTTCKSITFKVTFDFSGRTERISANAVPKDEDGARADGRWVTDNSVQLGLNYKLKLTPDSDSSIAEFTNTQTNTRYDNFHIHKYYTTKEASDLISDKTANKEYAIYHGYCSECQSTNPDYKAPMIATSAVAKAFTDGSSNYYFHNYKNIYGFNVVYEEDGTLSVNIHFDEYAAGDTFVIGLSDGTKTKYSEFTITDPDTSFFATVEHWNADKTVVLERDVRALKNTAKMVTIKGLSAKDIDTQLYIARMGKDGNGNAVIGRTHVFSLADYCMKVINEQDVYYVEDIIESDDTADGTVNNTAASKEEMKAKDKNVAAALINYGKAAKAALEQKYDGKASAAVTATDTWTGNVDEILADNGETGSADSPIIIDTPEELAYLVSGAGGYEANANQTAGKYYKVADGKVFNMAGLSGITLDSDLDAVKAATADTSKNWKTMVYEKYSDGSTTDSNGKTIGFQGNFDGNGLIVYSLYGNGDAMGLFPTFDVGAVIKNVTVKNSRLLDTGYSSRSVGGILGYHMHTNTTVPATIDGCTVENCQIESNSNNYGAGSIVGGARYRYVTVNNCASINNYLSATGTNGTTGVVGQANDTKYISVSNTIVVGSAIAPKSYGTYTNVYTDQKVTISGVTASLTTAQMTGSAAVTNMPNLDWSKWSYGMIGEYPIPATSATEAVGRIEYWDSARTVTASLDDLDGKGTSEEPYIIDSAADLALVAGATVDTANLYFEVADDIDAIVLQPESVGAGILSLTNSTAVKDYFEDDSKTGFTQWVSGAWSGHKPFTGNFNGNGAEIYGLYFNTTSTGTLAGLFTYVDAGAVISNLSVKNAYVNSATMASTIVAYTSREKDQGLMTTGTISLSQCITANCYIANSVSDGPTKAGVMVGQMNDYINISNCLVYGNDAHNTSFTNPAGEVGFELSLMGSAPNTAGVNRISNSIILGTTPYCEYSAGYNWMINNSPFSNVYTDQPTENFSVYYYQNSKWNEATDFKNSAMPNLTSVDANKMLGDGAATVVQQLNTVNNDKIWYVGAIDGYPSFSEVPALTTELLADYAAMTFDYDEYGDSTTEFGLYATSLNLKVNPYMSFTFAFHGDHKTYRDEIKVTFTTDDSVYTAGQIPAYTGEDITNENGWTNKYPAGRYHLYRLENIDVIDLCKGITINATHDTDAFEAKVSIGGFVLDLQNAYKADPCEYYSTRVEAAKALLYYAQMVNTRYSGQ